MHLRTLDDLGDLRGKRVLLRADFNVPVRGQRVLDATKVSFVVPTIERLRRAGARIILASHLGEGKRGATLAPIVPILRNALPNARVTFERTAIGAPALAARTAALRPGHTLLLENLRRYPGEERNAVAFARALAAIADVYVNDAFAVCHRRHASVVAVTRFLPTVAGPLLAREVAALARLLEAPTAPFVAVLGGAKIATKIPVIVHLLEVADAVLLGGALVHSFLSVRRYGIGASLTEPAGIRWVRTLLRTSHRRNLILPIDVVVADPTARRPHPRVVPIAHRKPFAICEPKEAILDIGPATIRAYAQQLRTAATIVWNGPMGVFERAPFHHGSLAIARVIAARSSGPAFGVVGGGETLAVLAQTGMARYIDHLSSGGGAMLTFLAGQELPGLTPLYAAD